MIPKSKSNIGTHKNLTLLELPNHSGRAVRTWIVTGRVITFCGHTRGGTVDFSHVWILHTVCISLAATTSFGYRFMKTTRPGICFTCTDMSFSLQTVSVKIHNICTTYWESFTSVSPSQSAAPKKALAICRCNTVGSPRWSTVLSHPHSTLVLICLSPPAVTQPWAWAAVLSLAAGGGREWPAGCWAGEGEPAKEGGAAGKSYGVPRITASPQEDSGEVFQFVQYPYLEPDSLINPLYVLSDWIHLKCVFWGSSEWLYINLAVLNLGPPRLL